MTTAKDYCWHFTSDELRDGRPIPKAGEWLKYDDKIVWCRSGLYFSRTPWDALQHANGNNLHMVEVDKIVREESNKGVCRRRKITMSMDAEELLRYFARMQVLSVIHIWKAPDVVIEYLMTGDEKIRRSARNAARNATWNPTSYAAMSEARPAAWSAKLSAKWPVTISAARSEFNSLVYESFDYWMDHGKEGE